jgi:hypothetical protein
MNGQELIAAARNDGRRFRIDQVVIKAGQEKWRGAGTLDVSSETFRLEVTLDVDQSEPPMRKAITGRSGFWDISGVVSGHQRFRTHGVAAHRSWNMAAGGQISLRIDTGTLELDSSGEECLEEDEFAAPQDLGADQTAQGHAVDDEPITEGVAGSADQATGTDASTQIWIKAVLPSFKLIFRDTETVISEKNPFLGVRIRSSGDTCHGELPGWKFGLVQRGPDLNVHFRSTDAHKSEGLEHDESLFNAFLKGVAFAHGQHAWPILFQHWRGGKLVRDRVQLGSESTRSSHAPFNEAFVYQALLGNRQWKLQHALEKAYVFFAVESQCSDEVSQLLYLFREATAKSVPYTIALLMVCSLFEGFVHAVYDSQIAPAAASDRQAFQAAKDQVCRYIKEMAKTGDRLQFERLHAILVNAEAVNLRAKFQALIAHLGLNRQLWEEIYSVWSKSRNPMAHRITRNDESEEGLRDDLIAESRIAGAINCLVLKLIGYTGLARRSAYEENYVQISPAADPGEPREAGCEPN